MLHTESFFVVFLRFLAVCYLCDLYYKHCLSIRWYLPCCFRWSSSCFLALRVCSSQSSTASGSRRSAIIGAPSWQVVVLLACPLRRPCLLTSTARARRSLCPPSQDTPTSPSGITKSCLPLWRHRWRHLQEAWNPSELWLEFRTILLVWSHHHVRR